MNRRIRSIFWLMTLCIIGINAFQGYWLWTTYQLNRQQFGQTVQDALFAVAQQSQMAQAKRLFAEQAGSKKDKKAVSQQIVHRFNTPAGDGQIRVFVRGLADTLPAVQPEEHALNQMTIVARANPESSGTPMPLAADTIARRISNLLLLDWAEGASVNVSKLSATYQAELLQRGINAGFRLDTLTIYPQRTAANVLIYQPSLAKKSEKSPDTVWTTPVPINPVRNLFAQASFTTPTFYLLRRMIWLLGSSVFLLLLTTGCFLFMLSTILRQKKLSEVKNDFINNMTHELKTPIATVTAAVEAMQHFGALNDPQKTQSYLTISRNNLQRLADLVDKVLNLAIEEKQELVLRPELVNLWELVNNLIANHQLQSSKSVAFTVSIPADTMVQVDRVHFSNALNNLIDNAIKYSGDDVRVHLLFSQETRGWQLSVKDNGIGIPKTYQSAIFDRFFRVPTGNLHPVKGFGLGLAYVRQVIERHGGRISVQSEPGRGSEFLLAF